MIRRFCAAFLVSGLAACATPAPAPETIVTEACNVYGRSLSVLAVARIQGRLTPEQIATVNQSNSIVVPLCTAPTPPAGAATVIESVNRTLEAMIFESNRGPVR